MKNEQNMINEPINAIAIPQLPQSRFEANQRGYYSNESEFYNYCACCGKGVKEPKFMINTIWGGSMYPANDNQKYNDAWTMPVGSECIKKIPTEYIIKGA